MYVGGWVGRGPPLITSSRGGRHSERDACPGRVSAWGALPDRFRVSELGLPRLCRFRCVPVIFLITPFSVESIRAQTRVHCSPDSSLLVENSAHTVHADGARAPTRSGTAVRYAQLADRPAGLASRGEGAGGGGQARPPLLLPPASPQSTVGTTPGDPSLHCRGSVGAAVCSVLHTE